MRTTREGSRSCPSASRIYALPQTTFGPFAGRIRRSHTGYNRGVDRIHQVHVTHGKPDVTERHKRLAPTRRPGWYNVLARTDFVPYLEPEKTPPHPVRPPSFTLPAWRTQPKGPGHCQICERRVVLPELVTLCCKILTLPYHRKDPSTLPRCCCI